MDMVTKTLVVYKSIDGKEYDCAEAAKAADAEEAEKILRRGWPENIRPSDAPYMICEFENSSNNVDKDRHVSRIFQMLVAADKADSCSYVVDSTGGHAVQTYESTNLDNLYCEIAFRINQLEGLREVKKYLNYLADLRFKNFRGNKCMESITTVTEEYTRTARVIAKAPDIKQDLMNLMESLYNIPVKFERRWYGRWVIAMMSSRNYALICDVDWMFRNLRDDLRHVNL